MTTGQCVDLSSQDSQTAALAGKSSHEGIQKRITELGRARFDKEVLVAWRCQVGPEWWDVCCEDTGRFVMSMVDWLALGDRPLLASQYRPPEAAPAVAEPLSPSGLALARLWPPWWLRRPAAKPIVAEGS